MAVTTLSCSPAYHTPTLTSRFLGSPDLPITLRVPSFLTSQPVTVLFPFLDCIPLTPKPHKPCWASGRFPLSPNSIRPPSYVILGAPIEPHHSRVAFTSPLFWLPPKVLSCSLLRLQCSAHQIGTQEILLRKLLSLGTLDV